ncbi:MULTISPECIES: hypothetical protein [unclassified Sphaerospermopsis]|uniref:hypothetical protein n=1 Tax=unclassified Sphaerospermopsis TaxID=2646443 RepID=UPI001F54944A|nr:MULTISPECIES: hypothetical protein [unclassified Sphaerospermopsis]
MYLLDTDILIDIQRGHAPAIAWFSGLLEIFLESLILDQVVKQEVFEINEVEYQKLITVSKCDYLELKKTIYGEKALAKLTVRVACRRHRYRST